MCKLFGQSPSSYFGIEENYLRLSFDLACAMAYWEHENATYEKSQQTAGQEALQINRVLEETRKMGNER